MLLLKTYIKKTVWLLSLTLLLTGYVTFLPLSVAAAETTTTTANANTNTSQSTTGIGAVDDEVKKYAQIAKDNGYSQNLQDTFVMFSVMISLTVKYMFMILIPILALIGKFMSNDWVTGNILNVDVLIGVIWQYVRNMVNIGIMFYLLYIAAVNIFAFGKTGAKVEVKKALPKVATALILVNFSLLLCRSILGISGVVANATFAIPNQIGPIFSQNAGDFFPFIWAEALGTRKIVSDSSGNAKVVPASTVTTSTNTTTSNTTSVQSTSGTISNTASVNYKADTSTGSKDTYVLECLHKNYAISMNSLQNQGDVGNMIIPNPVVDESGVYRRAWYHDYKIVVKERSGPAFEERKKWVMTNAGKAGSQYVSNEAELKARSTPISNTATVTYSGNNTPVASNTVNTNYTDNLMYPYYSDCVTDWNDAFFSSRNAMFVFAFNLMKVGEFENGLGNIASFTDLMSRTAIAVLYLLVFLAISLALAVAVIIRGIMLWFFMAMSPIWIAVMITGIKFKDSDNLGTLSSFTKLAFMPAVLGFVLSMTFMMINYIKYIGTLEGVDGGRIPLGALNIYFDANNPILGGMNTIFDMMVGILTVIAVWTATKAAFDFGFKETGGVFNTWYKNSAGKILETTGKLGSFVAKTPLEAPFIPVGKGRNISLRALSDFGSKSIDAKLGKRGEEHEAMLSEMISGRSRFDMDPETVKKIQNTFAQKNPSTHADIQKNISDLGIDPVGDVKHKKFAYNFAKALQARNSGTSSADMSVKIDDDNTLKLNSRAANDLYRNYAGNRAEKAKIDTLVSKIDSGDKFNSPLITADMWGSLSGLIKGVKQEGPEVNIDTQQNKITIGGAALGGTWANILTQQGLTLSAINTAITGDKLKNALPNNPNDPSNTKLSAALKAIYAEAKNQGVTPEVLAKAFGINIQTGKCLQNFKDLLN